MAKRDILTAAEQRGRSSRMLIAAFNLEAKLRWELLPEILSGDMSKLVEFQQYIQHASDPTKERLLADLTQRSL